MAGTPLFSIRRLHTVACSRRLDPKPYAIYKRLIICIDNVGLKVSA